jgi:hypothetical protein
MFPDMSTRERSPFCPKCAIPLNQPEPVSAPAILGGFGFSSGQTSRDCPECGQHLLWSATAVGIGAWVPGRKPKPARRVPPKRLGKLKVAPKAAPTESTPEVATARHLMSDRILSLAEVAASTPWSEEALSKLAEGPGSPFRAKGGLLVARESEIHGWLDSDEPSELPRGGSGGSRPRLAS